MNGTLCLFGTTTYARDNMVEILSCNVMLLGQRADCFYARCIYCFHDTLPCTTYWASNKVLVLLGQHVLRSQFTRYRYNSWPCNNLSLSTLDSRSTLWFFFCTHTHTPWGATLCDPLFSTVGQKIVMVFSYKYTR